MNIECRIKNREKRIMNNEGVKGSRGRGGNGKRFTVIGFRFTVKKVGASNPSTFFIQCSLFDIRF